MRLTQSLYKPKNPLLFISLFWAIGLFSAKNIQLSWTNWMMGITFSLVLFVFSIYLYKQKSDRWFVGLLISFLVFGFIHMSWYEHKHQTQLPEDLDEKKIGLQGVIRSEPVVDGAHVQFQVQPTSYLREQSIQQLSTKEKLNVNIYLKQESDLERVSEWDNGNGITFYGTLTKPKTARNPGQFDYAKYLDSKDIYWQINVVDIGSIQVSRNLSIGHSFDMIRERLSEPIDYYLTPPYSGFMKSLLLGDREDLSEVLKEDFSTLGLSHIIAISGLHLSVFTMILFWLLTYFQFTNEKRGIITSTFLVFYMLLVGASPSVVRATVMALITLFGVQYRKSFIGLQTIGMTFLLMTIYNPKWIVDIGFQLSFVVTFFLVWGSPKITNLLKGKVPDFFLLILSVLVISQLASFPLVFYYFHQYSLLSWLANLVFVPIFSMLVLPLGIGLLFFGLLQFPLTTFLGKTLDGILSLLFRGITWFGNIEGFQLFYHISWWLVLLLYGLILWYLSKKEILDSFLPHNKKQMIFRIEKLFFGLLLVCSFTYIAYSSVNKEAKVTMIDVGQGDSILIQSPNGRTVLVDSGGTVSFGKEPEWKKRKKTFSTGKDIILPFLRHEGMKQVDYAVVTHEDADHIQGFLSLVDHVPIRGFIVGDGFPRTELGEQLKSKLEEYQIPFKIVEKGEYALQLDSKTNITFLSLGNQSSEKENNQSLLMFVDLFETKFAFMGDLEVEGENRLVREYEIPQTQFLKVGHHGSSTSTSEQLLEQIRPIEAFVSVGEDNRYRHPSEEVMTRLAKNNTRIWRTDTDGAVTIHVTPNGYTIVKTLQ